MPHPADPARTVRIFDTWELACDHLQSHLLTEPECRAWALVIPEIRDLVELEEPESRWAYYQRAKLTEGGAAQKLYDAFSQSVRTAAGEAHRLRWFASRPASSAKTVTVALGTAGILMVVETWLVTAFLPGQGDPQAVREQQERGGIRKDVADSARPGIRSGRSGRTGPKDHGERARLTRQGSWSESEKLYYLVFKPAVQFIRSQYYDELGSRGEHHRGDYGLLKDVLPRMSQLGYDQWQAVRQAPQLFESGDSP
jgi:hypothetical protein